MTAPNPLVPIYRDHEDGNSERRRRDRLELLRALIAAPSFDPLFRTEVITIPEDHPTYRWMCPVRGCRRPRAQSGTFCHQHQRQWIPLRDNGGNQAEFALTAEPLDAAIWIGQVLCIVCPQRPATSTDTRLCYRHKRRWYSALRQHPGTTFEAWVAGETPLPGFGRCLVLSCHDLAASPVRLCGWHQAAYHKIGSPGGRSISPTWVRDYECHGKPVPVTTVDEVSFRDWCTTTAPQVRHGQINLRNLTPLVTTELQWGLYRHTLGERANWPLSWIQTLINTCRRLRVNSLVDLDVDRITPFSRLIAKEILNELRLIYFTIDDTRDAGFIDTEHFGVRFTIRQSYIDLTRVPQRWLRDLLWHQLADILRTPNPPRSDAPLDRLRRGAVELGTFLELTAPNGGHDPQLLTAEHMHRFAADLAHRERNGLPSLGLHRKDGQPTVVTPGSRQQLLNSLRRLLRLSLEAGRTDPIGLDRGFIVTAPTGGRIAHTSRRPFPDDVAEALASEANLDRLAAIDAFDGGVRDIWETLVATGRRVGEVRKLRLNCVDHYNGLPILWHDQTKVGNYDEAIRIPETIYHRLAERRHKTITVFGQRHGRPPTTQEQATLALFPTRVRNPSGTKSISYTYFHRLFATWLDELDLGHCVSHQARHTLATRLLRHGAGLHHIRRYLGHVSETMTERYAKIALSEIEDVLQHVWVAGPGAPHPGEVLSTGGTGMDRQAAEALVLDLSRRSTPAEGGFCTFQPVVQGGACPWNLDCHNCQNFVLSGADLLYWRRKREQWTSIAERAPADSTADYLHKVFEPTARAIDGLEKALAALGLLDDALALDLRRPQDYFNRIWSTAFRATDLATTHDTDGDEAADEENTE